MIRKGNKGNIFAGNGKELKLDLLDELNRQFEYLVSNNLYLEDMTLARLRENPIGTMTWDFEGTNPVYYRVFEKKTNISSVSSRGQYENSAIQTVYAFAITAMLISSNNTPLKRHARYVAGIKSNPYEPIRSYARLDTPVASAGSGPTLLQRAAYAVFSKENISGEWNKLVKKELSDAKLLIYLNIGEVNRGELVYRTDATGAGTGAAGPGFSLPSRDAGPAAPAPTPSSDSNASPKEDTSWLDEFLRNSSS